MARDMAEPCHFPPLDSAEQFFLLAYFLLDGGPHKLIGLPFLPLDAKQAPEALNFKCLNALLKFCRECQTFTSIEGDRENK